MTINQQFLLVHNDIIRNLDNRFVQYLDANLSVIFNGEYPQPYEVNLLSGTFNFQVKVNNVFYSTYSDEFYELTKKNTTREYIVKYSFLHNYCFGLFCTYFEIFVNGISPATAKEYLLEFEFFLKTQISTNNQEYRESYKHYWREILLRVMGVFESEDHSFFHLFNQAQRTEIITEFRRIEQELT